MIDSLPEWQRPNYSKQLTGREERSKAGLFIQFCSTEGALFPEIRSHCPGPAVFLQLLLRRGTGGEYCDQFVCLSACLSVCLSVHEHISGTAGPIFTKFCAQIPCGRGSVLLGRCCATLCTSDFMDDVMFGRIMGCMALRGHLERLAGLAVSYVRDQGGV